MYPMNPASGAYVFGYPLVENATIQLPNKKTLSIIVHKSSTQNKPSSIYKIVFNGQPLPVQSIKHTALLQGGILHLYVYE